MKFDVFHSIGRVDSLPTRSTDRQVFERFFAEASAAESFGYDTVWVAESHFSSEVQKRHPYAVIPNYQGEVGLNADSMQLAQAMFARTKRIGFGTAIMNIVGGNGGPIAAADRVRSLAFLNTLQREPRDLRIGVAAGRFPYINQPFGIMPRNPVEKALWAQYQQLIFVEALEIFLRLSNDEVISSADVTRHRITRQLFRDEAAFAVAQEALGRIGTTLCPVEGVSYEPRWTFDALKLVPDLPPAASASFLRFVLGSADPLARDHGWRFADLDIFNLSFTPPAAIDQVHRSMAEKCAATGRQWHRSRMPRTVLVFIDKDVKTAQERASRCFDTYIEAMRGTVKVPDKAELMERALIGDSSMIRAQLAPDNPRQFHADDRLMLWFEFNQTDGAAILAQMRQFAEDVLPHYT